MSDNFWEYLKIAGVLVLLFGLLFLFVVIASSGKPGWKICGNGWGNCVDTRNYQIKDGCAVGDNGERACGSYTITKESY